jgi:hypothetical protein
VHLRCQIASKMTPLRQQNFPFPRALAHNHPMALRDSKIENQPADSLVGRERQCAEGCAELYPHPLVSAKSPKSHFYAASHSNGDWSANVPSGNFLTGHIPRSIPMNKAFGGGVTMSPTPTPCITYASCMHHFSPLSQPAVLSDCIGRAR